MPNVQHNTMTGTNLHVPAYIQSSDPGAVGAGIGWLDTSTTPTSWKKRNASNTGWDVVVGIPNTDGSGQTNIDNNHVLTALAAYNLIFQAVANLTPHTAVDCATTAALPAGTYANGSSGVGATFTVTATGTLTIDGHLTVLNDRVLVKNQVSGLQNGVYLVSTAGATGVQAVLTRAVDSDTSGELVNAIYYVQSGTTNAGTFWFVANDAPIVIGTDTITFTQQQTPGQGGGPPGNTFNAPLGKSGNTVGVTKIDSLAAKTSLASSDEFILGDSAASFAPKKLTVATLDTRYAQVALSPLVADYATTTALPAGTYLNGVAGVGATFTVTATGTVTVDGHVLALNDRLLVKNQSSSFQDGLYTVTIAGAIGVALVLTRSIDMDTPAEFNGAFVTCINGTANAGTYWVQTATITTIGSDSQTWTQFNPSVPVTSVFSRTGAVTAQTGDYTAAQVTNAADKSSSSQQSFTGEVAAKDLSISGLTGAVTASRYVGAVAGAAPTSGTFAVGDFVVDTTLGGIWTCIAAGSPGTFLYTGPSVIVNHQTGTSYTITLADWGKLISCDNASAFTLTMPANGTTAIPQGFVCNVYQAGAGQVSVVVTTDTPRSPNGAKTAKQYSLITLSKIESATVTTISGDTTT